MQPPRVLSPKLYAVPAAGPTGGAWCEPIKRHTLQGLSALTRQVFATLDDLFYDLSKRATGSQEAQLYFETLRALRYAQQGIAEGFQQRMNAAFNAWCDSEPEAATSSAPLALLEGDALDIDLARNTMVHRARDLFQLELQQLQALLAGVLSAHALDERRNPLQPYTIAQAFVSACQQHLEVPLKALLIVFKLFEKDVLSQLGPVYQTLLSHLKQAGFTPVAPPEESTAPTPLEEPAKPALETDAAPTDASLNLAANALLAAVRSVVAQQGRYSQNAGPVMPSATFSAHLGGFQQQVNRHLDSGSPRNFIAEIASQILTQSALTAPSALKQTDEDIINLIALFFDEVLADDSLPMAIQTLVCRLQIPLLKIALREAEFFTQSEHPARRFINLLCATGALLDDSKPLEQDTLYPQWVEWVQRLSHNPQVDTAGFVEALAYFLPLVEKEQRRLQIIETRTQQTEAGRHRLAHARQVAQSLVYAKMRGLALPDAIGHFLAEPWTQALVFIYLRFGEASVQWQQAEQVIVDVLWLSCEHTDERSRSRCQRLLPEVRQHLLEGLSYVALDETLRHQLLEPLWQALTQPASVPSQPAPADALNPLDSPDAPPVDDDALTPIQRQMLRHEALMAEHYATAKAFQPGAWMAFTDDASGQVIKAKFSSALDEETCLFVNRLGSKLFEKTRQQLAHDLQRKRLRLLDSRPWFDRMLTAVAARVRPD